MSVMNDEQLDDLKGYIATTMSQTEQRLREELGGEMRELRTEMSDLRTEMREGFAGVAEALEPIHSNLDDHETRLGRLEESAADAA